MSILVTINVWQNARSKIKIDSIITYVPGSSQSRCNNHTRKFSRTIIRYLCRYRLLKNVDRCRGNVFYRSKSFTHEKIEFSVRPWFKYCLRSCHRYRDKITNIKMYVNKEIEIFRSQNLLHLGGLKFVVI